MSNISKLIYIVLTLAITYAFIYPYYGDISTLMDQREKYEGYMQMVKDIEKKKIELLTALQNIPDEDRKKIDTALPNSFDFVKLIADIDAVGSKYGIKINNISSREITSNGDSIAEAQPEKPYKSAIIGFTFNASYENFSKFMGELERSMRVLDIKALRINAQKSGINTYGVEFETYWIKT